MKHKLVCYCDGGLGNCISHFLQSVYLATKYNLDLIVVKVQSHICTIDFSKIFSIPTEITYINLYNEMRVANMSTDEQGIYKENMKNILTKFSVDTVIAHEILPTLIDVFNSLKLKVNSLPKDDSVFSKQNTLYFNNYFLNRHIPSDLCEYINKVNLKLNPNVLKSLKKYEHINEDYIGIHYRGTDNPFKKDIGQYIDNLVKHIPRDAKVLICSDEKEKETMIGNVFRNHFILEKSSYVTYLNPNISSYKYNYVRNETSCMEAFIEAILLGRTKIHNDGNMGSTFKQLGISLNRVFFETI